MRRTPVFSSRRICAEKRDRVSSPAMTRSYRSREGRVLVCLWILFHLCTVHEGRRYDKCLTRDGRQGVCVVKRYCREANHHALLSCDDDAESYCCPLPTSQRSAQPPQSPDRNEQRGPDQEEKTKHRPVAPRDPDRDDRLNKTPPPGDRRSPPRHGGDPPKKHLTRDKEDDNGRHRPIQPPDSPQEVHSERHDNNRYGGQTPPPARPNNNDRRDHPSRRPGNGRIHPTKDEEKTARNNSKDDTLTAPIRFPEPNQFSVPSPKVPACGVKPYELFIAGGEASNEHEWPWMTAIFRRHPDSRPKTFLCGGSLINTKYVLTAAHCFVNNYVILPPSSFVVRVGSHYLNSGEEYTVSNLVLHHNHSGSDFFNDIALVRLASEVYVTDKVAPICLPDPAMMWDDLVGRMATVAGWGDTSYRTGHTRILQHVTVPIVSGGECFSAYSRVRGAAFLARGSDHVICAGLREGGKDACLGDSGGPLMLKMPDDRWVIIGIVSLGYKCAEPGYPGVYTRVTHYMSWINNNMKRH